MAGRAGAGGAFSSATTTGGGPLRRVDKDAAGNVLRLRESFDAEKRVFEGSLEPLLYADEWTSPDTVWVRWARKWLLLSIVLLTLGFLVADIIFLIQMARNRVIEMPSTVSEAMAVGTAYARIYYGFEFIGALVQMISFYPFLLRNGACSCKRFGISNRMLRWMSPLFYVFFILIPTTEGPDPLSQTQRYIHEACAITSFALYLAAEVHTLFCSDLILRGANGREEPLYHTREETLTKRRQSTWQRMNLSAQSLLDFAARLLAAVVQKCSCWPSELLQLLSSVPSNLRTSFLGLDNLTREALFASPANPTRADLSSSPQMTEPADPAGGLIQPRTRGPAASKVSALETPLLVTSRTNGEVLSEKDRGVRGIIPVSEFSNSSSGESTAAKDRAAAPFRVLPVVPSTPAKQVGLPQDVVPVLVSEIGEALDESSGTISKRGTIAAHRAFYMFAAERAARLTAVTLSCLSFTLFFCLQVLYVVGGVRPALLALLSFVLEMFGALFVFIGLANIWYFAKPLQSSRQFGRYHPEDGANVFKRALDAIALAGLVLMGAHLWVLADYWSPAVAVSNCLDDTCQTCLPGTEHDRNTQPGGWHACDSLTSNAIFWTEKLGAACFCDPRPHLLDGTSDGATRDGAENSHRLSEEARRSAARAAQVGRLGGVSCNAPAYPYVIDVAPALMPFSLLRLEGCQIDDVRSLEDPTLSYLTTPGNPVSDFAAKGIACALIPADYEKTGSLSCNSDTKLTVYCADEIGRPVSFFAQQIQDACYGSAASVLDA
ncbi:unnamed protein product [Amoebophrya sp. A120]|nr:unnamed protein product [Amoebophrya sp. A120]|eukprot:GSA120T00021737001.1